MRITMTAALTGAVTLLHLSDARAGDCLGDPGYVLTMPETVGIGEIFDTCIDAPPFSNAFLLIALDSGTLPTKFGDLCLGLPLLGLWFVPVPETGRICFPHLVECDPSIVGFTGYFQFVALGPGAGQAGISNLASLQAVDNGACEPPGTFAGFTQGGWGQDCNGGNVGCLRDGHFADVFPDGLILGDPDGPDGDGHYALLLTTSQAVENFLPADGTPGALTGDLVNPLSSPAGVLAGQLAAAKLNVAFDDAGVFDALKDGNDAKLGDLVFGDCVHPDLQGKTLRDVIGFADQAISGEQGAPVDVDGDGEGDVSYSDLSDALDAANNNFDGGTQDLGCLHAQE